MIKALVIVLSDRASKGLREDKSGEILKELLEKNGFNVVEKVIIPDEKYELRKIFIESIGRFDVIFTSGGTGITRRDITPEVTEEFIEKRIYGIEVAMVIEGLKKTPHAAISRAVCGIKGDTLILNLPGSPKAAEENLLPILPAVKHIVFKIKNPQKDCLDDKGD